MNSFVENRCAGVKNARTFQTTASAVLRFEVRLRSLQPGCHARFKRDQRSGRAFTNDALREITRSEIGAGAIARAESLWFAAAVTSKWLEASSPSCLLYESNRVETTADRWSNFVLQSRPFFATVLNSSEECGAPHMSSRNSFERAREVETTLERRA